MNAQLSIMITLAIFFISIILLFIGYFKRIRCPECGERKNLAKKGSTRDQTTSFLQQNHIIKFLNYQESYECRTCGKYFQVFRKIGLNSNGRKY